MGILTWIVLGLISGAIAKGLMSGREQGGFMVTALLGIVGAFVGGLTGSEITGVGLTGLSRWSIVLAVLGSLLLLWIHRVTTKSRPI